MLPFLLQQCQTITFWAGVFMLDLTADVCIFRFAFLWWKVKGVFRGIEQQNKKKTGEENSCLLMQSVYATLTLLDFFKPR